MNWKIILQLSLLGLLMAFATISLIPQKIEPAFWLVLLIFSAYIIAKRCPGKYFLHGFLLSLMNCVWITGVHTLFNSTYLANHSQMAQMSANWPLANHPRLQMLITGPFFGVAFGIIMGLFALIASKLVKKPMAIS
jgi:hypothetical protein